MSRTSDVCLQILFVFKNVYKGIRKFKKSTHLTVMDSNDATK